MFNKLTRHLCLILLISTGVLGELCAQSHAYLHYAVDDGLPSSEVYFAMQDSKGFVWFSTDAGVCRFDGKEFELFDRNNGLTDNTVFQITEDAKGRIWFGTFSLRLCYFYQDSVYNYTHNDKIAASINNKKGMNCFYVDSLMNVYIGINAVGLFKIDDKGTIVNLNLLEDDQVYSNHLLYQVENTYLFNIISNSSSILKGDNTFKCTFQVNKGGEQRSYIWQLENPGSSRYLSFAYQDVYFTFAGNSLLLTEMNHPSEAARNIYSDIPNELIYAHYTDNENIWLSTLNNGVYKCVFRHDSLIILDQYLKDNSTATLFKDMFGGFWFQTLKDGVYYLPSDNILFSTYKNLGVSALEIDTTSGKVFVAFNDGSLTERIKEGHQLGYQLLHKFSHKIHALKYNPRTTSLIIPTLTTKEEMNAKEGAIRISDLELDMSTKDIFIDSNFVYCVGGKYLGFYKEKVQVFSGTSIPHWESWASCILAKGETVLIGTKTGLRILNGVELTTFSEDSILSSYITSIKMLDKETILLGTKSYGLILLKNNKIYDQINEQRGIAGSFIKAIHVDQNGLIWLGTNKGLSKVNYFGPNKDPDILNLTNNNGLITNEITQIKSYKNTLFLGTSLGLIEFNASTIKKNTLIPTVYFKSYFVNNQAFSVFDYRSFKSQENFFKINFNTLNFKTFGKNRFKYRMLGVDSSWLLTNETTVQYPTLPPGDYSFELRASNEDNIWSAPIHFSFTIQLPMWREWWFVTLMLILLSAAILYAINSRERKLKEKAFLQTKIMELELKSLRSQMNPLFIFNTLNTIQTAIHRFDKKFASNYIAQFGKLIRLVLESSKKSTIYLGTEMEMLTLFIKLEAERFSGKMKYQIVKDSKIDPESIKIPSMVIQPFVENAIIHGLSPQKEKNCLLNIEFKLVEENNLVCIIEDNGIGRAAAATRLNAYGNKTEALGTQISIDRLNHYSKETNSHFSFEIFDLFDENKAPEGTKVEIIFYI